MAALVRPAKLDGLGEQPTDVECRGHDVDALVRDVVLHARLGVDGQLNSFVHGATETRVVFARVQVVSVVLGVVDVVLGSVAAQALGGHLELPGSIAKGHESEDAEEQANRLGRD